MADSAQVIHDVSQTESRATSHVDSKGAFIGLICVAVVALSLLIVGLLWSQIFELVFQRGVPYAILIIFCWSLGIIVMRYRSMQFQQLAWQLDMLPKKIISTANIDSLISQIMERCRAHKLDPEDSILVRRVCRVLENFKVQKSHQHAAEVLRHGAEIDEAKIESRYMTLRVFIWAMPILGFIGTVVGIGQALHGFSSFIRKINDASVLGETLPQQLSQVGGGLATAFNTTLLALVLSIPVMMLTSHVNRMEHGFLAEVDVFLVDNLLGYMEGENSTPGPLSADTEHQLIAIFDKMVDGASRIMESNLSEHARAIHNFVIEHLECHEKLLADLCTNPIRSLNTSISHFDETTTNVQENLNSALHRSEKLSAYLAQHQNRFMEQFNKTAHISNDLKATSTYLGKVATYMAEQKNNFVKQGDKWLNAFDETKQELITVMSDHQERLAEIGKSLEKPREIRLKAIDLVEEDLRKLS